MSVRNNMESVVVHLPTGELDALDAWLARQNDPDLTRAEAIRHLVTAALSHDLERRIAQRSIHVDEGLRPEQLTSENDD